MGDDLEALIGPWRENPVPARREDVRLPRRNPYSTLCVFHRRRICAVCTHYQGALAAARADRRTMAPCAAFSVPVRGARSAAFCHRFERKTQ